MSTPSITTPSGTVVEIDRVNGRRVVIIDRPGDTFHLAPRSIVGQVKGGREDNAWSSGFTFCDLSNTEVAGLSPDTLRAIADLIDRLDHPEKTVSEPEPDFSYSREDCGLCNASDDVCPYHQGVVDGIDLVLQRLAGLAADPDALKLLQPIEWAAAAATFASRKDHRS